MGSSARTSSLPHAGPGPRRGAARRGPVALAAEGDTDTDEYAERVEPICKANTEANSRILKGVKDQVKQGKLVPAGKRFIRARRRSARP